MISVVIADDHDLVRAGLTELLAAADDIDVVETASDGESAVEAALRWRPQVVLMDLSMPRTGGIEATRRIVAADPEMRVVVLTSTADTRQVLAALDAGATGYLLKDASPDELRAGIRAAARGESPLSPKAGRVLLGERAADAAATLSAREAEVLALVAEGLPNKLIARRLGISEGTVKAHLTRVYQTIGATDRTQAALWAKNRGIGPT
jgi:DNA-binding NarL/FixJ family response regulator